MCVEQYKLNDYKIIELNSNLAKNSIKLSPEEVSNLTTIEIFRGAEKVVCNTSYAYQLAGFLNKPTIAIMMNKPKSSLKRIIFTLYL